MLQIAMIGGPTDLAIVAVVVMVLFGGSKIGGWGKNLGEGIREFKKATKDDDPAGKGPTKDDEPTGKAATQAPTVGNAKDEELKP